MNKRSVRRLNEIHRSFSSSNESGPIIIEYKGNVAYLVEAYDSKTKGTKFDVLDYDTDELLGSILVPKSKSSDPIGWIKSKSFSSSNESGPIIIEYKGNVAYLVEAYDSKTKGTKFDVLDYDTDELLGSILVPKSKSSDPIGWIKSKY